MAQTANENTPRIERIPCGTGNCFIVSQDGSAILVDTATPGHKNKILEACRGKNIRLIVLTHGHYDHTQNAAFLSGALGVPVAMHPADIPLLRDMAHEPMLPTDFTSACLVTMLKLSRNPFFRRIFFFMNVKPFEPAVLLHEGFSFTEYGIAASVIALPGHTQGSVGIVTEDSLIAGDALTNLFAPGKAALYSDEGAMLESAEKAATLGDVTVYVGHGKPMKNRDWQKGL